MKYLVPESTESERLILRQFVESDLQDLHEYYSDRKAIQYTQNRDMSPADTWRSLACMVGHWQIKGYGPYAIALKSTQKVIGISGFWYPIEWPEPEIKWALNREFWGQGFAKEATLSTLSIAKQYLPDQQLISLIHSDNLRSINVAKSVSAKFEKNIEFRNGQWCVYRHQ